ncbi:MAG TPA: hypothetical protein VHY76_12360, partial [Acetobacteraceae bacterium]|nr:hypothetical protein [Acetobacteraceae bacterium]
MTLQESLIDPAGIEAQSFLNFALFEPTHLPAGLRAAESRLRPEAQPPENEVGGPDQARAWTASHRTEYSGSGRRLSVKQFLYDWAPPAYDHPSLWRTPEFPVAHPVQEAIAW